MTHGRLQQLDQGDKLIEGGAPTIRLQGAWQELTEHIEALEEDKQAADATLDALSALDATAGLLTQTGADTFAKRTLAAPAAGLTITNPAGTAGDPTFALANDLAALEGLGSTGIAVRTAADTWAQRSLTAPAAGLTITNPAGIAGSPTFALADDLAALEALSGTNTIYYRSAASTWTAVTVSANVGFSGGSLGSATGTAATKNTGTSGNTVPLLDAQNTWADVQLFDGGLQSRGTSPSISIVDTNSTTTAAAGTIRFRDQAGTDEATIVKPSGSTVLTFNLGSGGTTGLTVSATAVSPVSATTASAANVHQASSGSALLRVTSGRKYKQAITDLPSEAMDKLLHLRPITYRSRSDADDQTKVHWGLIAEEVHEILPALVGYDDSGAPDWVQYERVVVGLMGVAKTERAARLALEARVLALETRARPRALGKA